MANFPHYLSRAMAGKLRMVTEQKTLCRNLAILQKSIVQIHQQQCGLALRAMSKGTQTRLAQIPEQAKFLMKRFVTDFSSDVLHVDHSTMMLPVSTDRRHKKRKTDKQLTPGPSNNNLNRFEFYLVLQMEIIVWSLQVSLIWIMMLLKLGSL